MYKEEKIASLQQDKNRLQLLKITVYSEEQYKIGSLYLEKVKYQVRLNRKIINTSINEYEMRKLFATYAQNIILKLKIY